MGGGSGDVGEVDPGGVPAHVAAGGAAGIARERKVLGIAGKGARSIEQGPAQVSRGPAMGAAVVGNALVRAGEEVCIIRLAWVGDGERLSEEGSLRDEGIDIRSRGGADDLGVGVVFLHHDNQVIGHWYAVRGGLLGRKIRNRGGLG